MADAESNLVPPEAADQVEVALEEQAAADDGILYLNEYQYENDLVTDFARLVASPRRRGSLYVAAAIAALTRPRLLLLDEHTAALDPKTASKVLNLTEEIVDENHLTTLMVTHNMNDAIRLGNRLIMMHEGHVIYDVAGNEKKSLTVADLLQKFEEVSGGELANDRMLLS